MMYAKRTSIEKRIHDEVAKKSTASCPKAMEHHVREMKEFLVIFLKTTPTLELIRTRSINCITQPTIWVPEFGRSSGCRGGRDMTLAFSMRICKANPLAIR
ncbi:hypothetical protein Moror_10962, partial [Moniliophthora roreri MCA 2997]